MTQETDKEILETLKEINQNLNNIDQKLKDIHFWAGNNHEVIQEILTAVLGK